MERGRASSTKYPSKASQPILFMCSCASRVSQSQRPKLIRVSKNNRRAEARLFSRMSQVHASFRTKPLIRAEFRKARRLREQTVQPPILYSARLRHGIRGIAVSSSLALLSPYRQRRLLLHLTQHLIAAHAGHARHFEDLALQEGVVGPHIAYDGLNHAIDLAGDVMAFDEFVAG